MHHRTRLLVLLYLLTASCGDGCASRGPETRARPARPALRLFALTDLSGYLEPCGCQSRPLGGIDKAAQRMRELSADGVPGLLLAAGNLFFGSEAGGSALDSAAADHGEAASLQQQWQAQTLARALAKLGLAASVPGAADLARGSTSLSELGKLAGAQLLCAPAATGAMSACRGGSTLIERGGTRVGLWGLGENAASQSPQEAAGLLTDAKRLTGELRARGAELVIGLLAGEARTARRVALAIPGLDFLLHGGADSAEVPAPERIGDTTLLRAGHQGQGVLVVDLFETQAAGPFRDGSAWTRQAAQAAQQRRSAELAARIDAWRRDPNIDRAQLAAQQRRLEEMRPSNSEASSAPETGKRFTAQFLELDAKTAADPELRALLVAHDRRVNEHNRETLAELKPKPVAPGMPGYIGSERCGSCHASALQWWQQHPHGHAYATLEHVEKQFSLSCVNCHVTGYGKPGGASVVLNAGLTNVGCESCHGPGSLHAVDQDTIAAKNVQRQVPESTCRACHDSEHSDRFEYASYRQRLMVPGHGKPAADGQVP